MKKAILTLLGLLVLLGCERLVIQKKSLLVTVPSASNEIHIYYVFEGISLRNQNEWAQSDLDRLGDAKFGFLPSFVPSGLLKLCKFEELRFFVDPKRTRKLCADRRMSILNRSEFAEIINHAINEAHDDLPMSLENLDVQAIKAQTKTSHDQIVEQRRILDALVGPVPYLAFIEGLLVICEKFDDDSIRQVIDARRSDFQWLRFEPDSAQLVLPVTVECARRIAADPTTAEWLTRMRNLVSPIELLSRDDGLVIAFGSKGKVIRFGYTDDRRYAPAGESKILQLAGEPKPILVNAKAETADSLMEQFIFEQTAFRIWNDASGNFTVMAKFSGFVGGKVVLEKEDGSKAYVTREQLGKPDLNYLDAIAK